MNFHVSMIKKFSCWELVANFFSRVCCCSCGKSCPAPLIQSFQVESTQDPSFGFFLRSAKRVFSTDYIACRSAFLTIVGPTNLIPSKRSARRPCAHAHWSANWTKIIKSRFFIKLILNHQESRRTLQNHNMVKWDVQHWVFGSVF
jgi:hypothetical protein